MGDLSSDGSPAPSGVVFGPAAEAYEQYRLGYPAEVTEAVMAYAERPVRAALEIGAGTGRRRGCSPLAAYT